MIKKIILIVLGSLFAVVAVVVILFYVKGPFVGFLGSRTGLGRAPSPTAASKLQVGTARWIPLKKRLA